MILYDCKQAREARTTPHRRAPPLQLLRLKRAIGATLEARAKAAGMGRVAILPGDTHVLFDGGKEGHRSKMKAAFVDDQGSALKSKAVRTLQLVFSEDTAAERRGCTGGGKPTTEPAALACHAGQARHADEEAQTLRRHEPRGRAGGCAGVGR